MIVRIWRKRSLSTFTFSTGIKFDSVSPLSSALQYAFTLYQNEKSLLQQGSRVRVQSLVNGARESSIQKLLKPSFTFIAIYQVTKRWFVITVFPRIGNAYGILSISLCSLVLLKCCTYVSAPTQRKCAPCGQHALWRRGESQHTSECPSKWHFYIQQLRRYLSALLRTVRYLPERIRSTKVIHRSWAPLVLLISLLNFFQASPLNWCIISQKWVLSYNERFFSLHKVWIKADSLSGRDALNGAYAILYKWMHHMKR